MPQYKVRATKREEGDGYNLSYGKGSKKITSVTRKDPSNGKWFESNIGHFKKLSELKPAWGDWAARQYNGTSKANGETVPAAPAQVPPPPPPIPVPPPPPAATMAAPPVPAAPRPRKKGNGIVPMPPEGVAARAEFLADEDNPLFRYPKDHPDSAKAGKDTPLGMLMQIQDWHERYRERVSEVNAKIAAERIPGFNPFSFLRLMIDECVEREIPQSDKESTNEQL